MGDHKGRPYVNGLSRAPAPTVWYFIDFEQKNSGVPSRTMSGMESNDSATIIITSRYGIVKSFSYIYTGG